MAERNCLTRQIGALLDSVAKFLDHFASKLEASENEAQPQSELIRVEIPTYARVLATFAAFGT